ncbi:MAG: hypothetical protein J6W18_01620 [Bacteroidaceae bacterium]|nr:hypothetical protein [Bacteroidaceae bacterium]
MPYRRLPNTDKARIRSLETAIAKMRNNDYYAPVLSPELFSKADKKLQQFKGAVERYVTSLDAQVNYSKSEPYQNKLKNAKMYVSHFLTVFNMCIKRGEMKASDRKYYSIPEDSGELPDMSSDIAVIRCCENTIRGEKNRTNKGGIPIYNPTIAKVAVHYELFKELYDKQCELRQLTDEALMVVSLMRPQIDEVILEVWNSIENYFSDMTGEKKLKTCRDYGLIYYYRTGEKAD